MMQVPWRTDTDEEGVSPVVGVILVVAITVVLSAAIGAFVFNLGSTSTSQPTQAGISMTETENGVEVTLLDKGNGDSFTVQAPDGAIIDGDANLTEVGQTVTVTGLEAGDQVSVTDSTGDSTNLVQSHTASPEIDNSPVMSASSGSITPCVDATTCAS